MAIQRTPCGGFSYDDSQIEFVDNVIQVKGGGGSGGVAIFDAKDVGGGTWAIQATAKELWDACQTQSVLTHYSYDDTQQVVMLLGVERHGTEYIFSFINDVTFRATNDSDNPTSKF